MKHPPYRFRRLDVGCCFHSTSENLVHHLFGYWSIRLHYHTVQIQLQLRWYLSRAAMAWSTLFQVFQFWPTVSYCKRLSPVCHNWPQTLYFLSSSPDKYSCCVSSHLWVTSEKQFQLNKHGEQAWGPVIAFDLFCQSHGSNLNLLLRWCEKIFLTSCLYVTQTWANATRFASFHQLFHNILASNRRELLQKLTSLRQPLWVRLLFLRGSFNAEKFICLLVRFKRTRRVVAEWKDFFRIKSAWKFSQTLLHPLLKSTCYFKDILT